MLKMNVWTRKGLVNGALGFVRDIIYAPGTFPPDSAPMVIMVELDKYQGPTFANNCVPITPHTVQWFNKGITCTRIQFPLALSWALTVHKARLEHKE